MITKKPWGIFRRYFRNLQCSNINKIHIHFFWCPKMAVLPYSHSKLKGCVEPFSKALWIVICDILFQKMSHFSLVQNLCIHYSRIKLVLICFLLYLTVSNFFSPKLRNFEKNFGKKNTNKGLRNFEKNFETINFELILG